MKETVDIIMPNYNKGEYLEKSIKSVINQTYKFWKLYLIDDNSTDKSISILKNYKKEKRIKIILLKKNKGPSYCRNIGLKLSKSNLICFLDSDDFWYPKKIEKQLIFIKKNNYNFIFSDYYFNKNKSLKNTKIANFFDYRKFILNSAINTSTMMLKRKIIKNTKFRNTEFEDYIFKCEVLKKGHFAYKNNYISAHYVRSNNSRSVNKLNNIINLFKVNQRFLKLNFFSNIKSIFFISFNFLKKYKLL